MRQKIKTHGVLLHITSLPGRYGIGEIGQEAYDFIDSLEAMGQNLWQILPTVDTGLGASPYMAISAFANNPSLISFDLLIKDGLLDENELSYFSNCLKHQVEYDKILPERLKVLDDVASQFFDKASTKHLNEFQSYCDENQYWLNDYALFVALKSQQGYKDWSEWTAPISFRENDELIKAEVQLEYEILNAKILQYLFENQWRQLKKYARKKGIQLVGDVPIYIAYDSVDVWSNPNLFKLDKDGKMVAQAGCPPDYFQLTGQIWGNPLYDWDAHKQDDYQWWILRLGKIFEMVDIVRIDHFNGFVKYWEIPIDAETAKPGEWIKGPNEHLLRKIHQAFHDKIIIAEDLGEANELAKVLREKYNIPGMEIVQFTLEEALEKEISPTFEQYPRNSVVYTGTHDNDTIIGWYDRFALAEKNDIKLSILQENFGDNRDDFHWKMISFAYNSDAKIVIVPLQDILGLDSSARMNTPGTIKGNWRWRFTEKMLTHSMIKQMKELTLSTNRITF